MINDNKGIANLSHWIIMIIVIPYAEQLLDISFMWMFQYELDLAFAVSL